MVRAIESRVQKLSFAAGVIHEAKRTVWYSNEQYSTTAQYVQIGPAQCVKIQELGSAAGMYGKKVKLTINYLFPEERNCQRFRLAQSCGGRSPAYSSTCF